MGRNKQINMTPYTGVTVINQSKSVIDSLYQEKELELFGELQGLPENQLSLIHI